MALIAETSINQAGPFTPTKTVLSAADTLVYTANSGQMLVCYNITGVDVNVTIDGSAGTTVTVPGTGGTTLSVAAGLVVTVPANGFKVVSLDKVSAYAQGTVAVTGGVGVIAAILK